MHSELVGVPQWHLFPLAPERLHVGRATCNEGISQAPTSLYAFRLSLLAISWGDKISTSLDGIQ
jgi:hypothetical protein